MQICQTLASPTFQYHQWYHQTLQFIDDIHTHLILFSAAVSLDIYSLPLCKFMYSVLLKTWLSTNML